MANQQIAGSRRVLGSRRMTTDDQAGYKQSRRIQESGRMMIEGQNRD